MLSILTIILIAGLSLSKKLVSVSLEQVVYFETHSNFFEMIFKCI